MIQQFLDYIAIERKYSPRTIETYGDDLREFRDFMSGNDAFSAEVAIAGNPRAWQLVGEDDVKMWVYELTEGKNGKKKNSPRSVHQKLSALHSFYRYMLQQGLVKKDVTRRVVLPKVDKPLPKFFKPQEMEAFESTKGQSVKEIDIKSRGVKGADANGQDISKPCVKDRRASRQRVDYDGAEEPTFETLRNDLIIEVLYETGMRQAELLGLKDSDWDLEQGSVRIFGKRRKERIVPIGDNLIEQIRTYLAVREDWLEGKEAPAFFVRRVKKDVAAMSEGTLYSIVRTRMGEVSTQQKRSPHVLRHTFATTMLNNGADIRTIQTLLGHASLRATQIYTHATFKQLQDAYERAHPRAKKGR